jgi:hypothetical protein
MALNVALQQMHGRGQGRSNFRGAAPVGAA